ncbi:MULTISPECIES: DUF6350 family protein [Actinomadura]|uniref:DUF6350 family protein n=1 Tax=Actinomadura yumaensis TaxID=111807 RepID=A0ABW2CV70_9ACTN|nr:DUF6350 family protein [Actinomadura sp. J1-007]
MSDLNPGRRAIPDRSEPSRAASGQAAEPGPADAAPPAAPAANRPLYVTGLVAALWCVGIGLAVLTTITLIGWIAAPRTALGSGLPGVFRTAVNFWLMSHHAGFSSGSGRVGLLPLGVLVLPGALLYRSGGWMIRVGGMPARHRSGVVHVALALAAPYAALSGLLALAASSQSLRPSAWQALVACFVVAAVAGGLGAARAVVAIAARGRRVRSGLGALLRLLPGRARSLVIGVAGATAVLMAAGAVLVGGSLAAHLGEADRVYSSMAPGIVGGVLLLVVELAFLPNAVIWGMAYAIGPGFSVGAGTSVSPTGVFLDVVPVFPPLAALPEAGPAPAVSLVALAAPFVAGAVGGVLTIRAMPSPVYEGAPLWGFVSGALTGAVVALLAALSGGPLGDGRMATVGPSAWQVGLMAALEVGIASAIAAWVANWRILRAPAVPDVGAEARKRTKGKAQAKAPEKAAAPLPAPPAEERPVRTEPAAPAAPERPAAPARSPYAPDPLEFEEAEPVLAPRRPRGRGRAEEPLPELIEETAPQPAAKPAKSAKSARSAKSVPPDESGPEPAAEAQAPPAASSGPERYESSGLETLEDEPQPDEPPRREPPRPAATDAGTDVPAPRDDPERTETRGGAIYVLRDEPRDD